MWLPLAHALLGTWPATQECALSGNPTSDTLVLRPALNPLSHTSQVFFWNFDLFFHLGHSSMSQLTSFDKCFFFNSLVVGLPYSLIFLAILVAFCF